MSNEELEARVRKAEDEATILRIEVGERTIALSDAEAIILELKQLLDRARTQIADMLTFQSDLVNKYEVVITENTELLHELYLKQAVKSL